MSTPEVKPGQTWDVKDNRDNTMYVLLVLDLPCAKNYHYVLSLWSRDDVSIDTGEMTYYEGWMFINHGSLLS